MNNIIHIEYAEKAKLILEKRKNVEEAQCLKDVNPGTLCLCTSEYIYIYIDLQLNIYNKIF